MVQVEKLEGNKAKLTIEIEAPLFAKALNDAFHKTASRYNVPGFRKGKAPRRVIENAYGEYVFYEDAFDLCWGDAYDQALETEGLTAVDKPELDIVKISEAEGVTFTAEVQLKPEVTLGQYLRIEAVRPTYTVTDAELDAALDAEREKQARWLDVDRPVEQGDKILFDYSGSIDGVQFDGGTAEQQTLYIGSNTFIPGFEEQLVGMRQDEEKDVTVTFPAEYHAENLAGKEAVFHCKLHAVQVKELPKVDDELIADISEFDTVDAWKENKRAELTKEHEENAKNTFENSVLKAVCDNATVEIPACMIDRQVDYIQRDLGYRLSQSGLDLETYCAYMGTDKEKLMESYRPEAEARVKMQLVIEAITAKEKIEATDEEIDEQIKAYAEKNELSAEDFAAQLSADDREYLFDRATADKTLKAILDSAVALPPKAEEAQAE